MSQRRQFDGSVSR